MGVLWWILVTVVIFLIIRKRKTSDSSLLGVDGTVVYADQGRKSKLFINRKYQISAKPDFIIRTRDGQNVMVEFKSRVGRVYQSDVVQLKASVLAVRATMPIHRARVVTKSEKKEITLGSNESLYLDIEKYAAWARQAKSGEIIPVYAEHAGICRTCSVAHSCQKNGGR